MKSNKNSLNAYNKEYHIHFAASPYSATYLNFLLCVKRVIRSRAQRG